MRRLGVTLLLALVACASPSGPARVTGTVAYRERSALAPGSEVRVTLVDVSLVGIPERVIAEQVIVTSGEQVPIPFALAFDRAVLEADHRYGVRASIREPGGRLAFATLAAHPVPAPGASGEQSVLVQRVAAGATPAGPRLLSYACDGLAFRVEVTREHATVFLPGRSITLPAVPAASGAKYSDGRTTYWSHGDEARLVEGGVEYTGCRERPFVQP